MLKGYFSVTRFLNDAGTKKESFQINLFGYDLRNTVTLYGFCSNLKSKFFFQGLAKNSEEAQLLINEKTESIDWEPRHGVSNGTIFLGIGLSKMTIENPYVNGEPSEPNTEYLEKLGSMLRQARSMCVPKLREDFYDLGERTFQENKKVKYSDSTGSNYVVLQNGLINELQLSTGGYEQYKLVLRWDDVPATLLGNKPDNYTLVSLKSPFPGLLGEEAVEENWNLGTGEFFSLSEIISRNPLKSYDWLKSRDYKIVRKEDLEWVKGYLLSEEWDLIAFDTETTGLNMNFKSQVGEGDQLVGLVFSVKPGESFYVPLRHRFIENVCEEWEIQGVLDEYFKDILETKPLLAHNVSFDWKTMWVHGINCNFMEDTLTLFHLSMGVKGEVSGAGLKTLANEILGRDSLELSDFVDGSWGTGGLDFRDLPEEEVRLYACADTDNTLELYLWAKENDIKLKYGLSKHKLYDLEVKFSKAIGYQEFYGHKVAVDRAEELTENVEKEIAEIEQRIFNLAGYEFNVGSSVQLAGVLYNEMGAPVLELTASGKPSTSKGVLKKLKKLTDEAGNPAYPVVGLLLDLKELKTLYNNFLKKLPETATEDGYLFSSVRQFLETGRVSITKPNYQSYNDTVKKYIVPREGYYICDADYSAVEYRVLASMSGQENLIQAFHDPDLDYHTVQAARMFNIPYENVTKAMRSNAKGVNFGVPYGLGNRGLGGIIYGVENEENTRKAADLKEKYFEGQDKVRAFFDVKRQFGIDHLYAETLLGRRRYFNPQTDRVDSIRRAAGNMPIQGSAADLYKTGMVRFFSWIQKNNLLGDILLTGFIHDEVLVEVKNEINPAVVLKYLKAAMKINIQGWAPLEIGCGFGRNWYEAKSTEIPIYLQEELISALDSEENELEWWDTEGYDLDRLYDWEVARIFRHQAERVRNYVLDKENWGNTVKAAINSNAHDAVNFAKSDKFKELLVKNRGYMDWISQGLNVDELRSDLDIVGTLRECCKLFGEDVVDIMDKSGLRNPNEEVVATKSDVEKAQEEVERVFSESNDLQTSSQVQLVQKLVNKALTTGQSVSLEDRIMIVSPYLYYCIDPKINIHMYRLFDRELSDVLNKFTTQNPNGLDTFYIDPQTDEVHYVGKQSIQAYVALENVSRPNAKKNPPGTKLLVETILQGIQQLKNGELDD